MQQRTVSLVPSDDIRWTVVEATLRTMTDVAVIDRATSATDAVAEIARLRPDVVIAAAVVGGESARTFLTEVRRICGPTVRLAVLATEYDPTDVLPFAKIRPAAYFLWDDLTSDTLDCCLATVLTSPMFAGSPAVMEALAATLDEMERQSHRTVGVGSQGVNLPEGLTPRERQLLDALARGWDNARIADELCSKNQTVRCYISDLCAKLGISSHYEAIVWAKDRGFGAT